MKKHIRSYGVFSIATGAMISSGIFILPSLAFGQLGPAVSLAYLVAGLFALAGSFSIIELATAMPRDGGDYYYIHRTFGGFIGSISGLFGWVALSLKSAFAIFGISEVLLRLFAIPTNISAIVLCIAFVLLNAVGTKEAIIFQNVLVFCLLALLALYCLFGLIFSIRQPETAEAPGLWRAFQRGFALENFSSREKLRSVLSVSGFVFISFGGLLKVTNISGEVAQPKRDLPLGMSLSIIIVTFFYTLMNIILVAVMVPETLSGSLAPVADSARRIMAGWGQNTANRCLLYCDTCFIAGFYHHRQCRNYGRFALPDGPQPRPASASVDCESPSSLPNAHSCVNPYGPDHHCFAVFAAGHACQGRFCCRS